MATFPNTGGFRPVTPSNLRAGIVLSVEEASRIAEALVTIQQVAARVGINLIDRLDVLEGDSDLEGEWSEDEISSTPTWITLADGPGCQIADAGGQCDEDDNNTDLGRTLDAHGPGCELSDPDCAADDIGCDDN